MSKSIEDYRNIIKILKLQLLKIRQQNAGLSHNLGIAAESETSSFSPRLTHYGRSQQPYAKTILAFLQYAHRCEILGLTPEMVFRIADKKRDKKVTVGSFAEILKRLKLHMGETEIRQLTNLLSRGGGNIQYDEYLQCLSAFQVNSEKYPPKSVRTYVQLCLIKFGQEVTKKEKDVDKLFRQMNGGEDKPYLSFENYAAYTKRNASSLQEFEIVAVFVGLDLASECQIEKSIFRREMGKVLALVGQGVSIEDDLASMKEPEKGERDRDNRKSEVRKEETNMKGSINKSLKRETSQAEKKDEDNDIKYEEETGEEAGNKVKKPVAKKPAAAKSEANKLSKGDSVKILGQFKKLGIRISDFMQRLISQQPKTTLVKSFTIHDFLTAIRTLNKDTPKKKVLELFRALDTEANGTLDTSQLLKLWLRGKQVTDTDEALYRLLYRHLREIQFQQPAQRFEVLGIDSNSTVDQSIFSSVFCELNLEQQEISHILSSYIGNEMKISTFSEQLKAEGKPPAVKQFKKMDRQIYDEFRAALTKINAKKGKGEKRFRKLMRLETGEKSTDEEYWDSIFTDEWACWQYCLETASKLETFWRDPEFGPTKADPSGYRSIVGNESNVPPGLPDESEISWMSFEQILAKQRNPKEKVVFMQKTLQANDVVQGKLGDCWFVSSLSIIANNEEYLRGATLDKCRKRQDCSTLGVNPFLFKFFIRYGLYVFKYFKKFQPVYVVVDDLFPVETSSSELLFAKSPNPGVQWVAFLEKSYAKLHHAYSNMISGDIAQGLNDLTNALPIKEAIEEGKPQNLDKIRLLNNEQQLMGCSITAPKGAGVESPVTLDDQKCGLFYSHAYSILDLLDLHTKQQDFNLIRVRNPWGHGQWFLDWSDNPIDKNPQYTKFPKYQPDLDALYKKKIDLATKAGKTKPIPYRPNDDGEFLMKFEDFNKIYTNLFTGYVFQREYKGQSITERWDEKYPSGICKLKDASDKQRSDFVKNNHQYLLEIKEDQTDVLMYIVQEDGRLYRGEKYPYKQLCNGILILSFSLNNEKSLEKFDADKLTTKALKFELRREVNMWYRFPAGKYAIVPCKMKNPIVESEFEFRIYSDKEINIKKIKGNNNSFRPIPQTTVSEVDKTAYGGFLQLLAKHA